MKLKDIIAISGKGGLYKFISQGRNAIIVESFADKKRTSVYASTKVSSLDDIAIFTNTEDVPLAEVLKKISNKENGEKTISHKSSPEELKGLFEDILPDYDRERVYVSDMKKVVNWYNLMHDYDLLNFEEEGEEEKKEEPTADEKPETASEPKETNEEAEKEE
jgi:hypothetical protein